MPPRKKTVARAQRRAGRASTGRPRDVEATKRRLVGAVGAILARRGFAHLGVNAVAAQAGADKALIYRYFGGFGQLLEAYAESAAFWPTTEEMAGGPLGELGALPLPDRVARIVHGYIAQLRARPLTQEILAWELSDRNEVTARLEEVRERRGLELMMVLARDLPPTIDIAGVASILAGGVHYLLLRARRIRVFNGIDLHTEDGWARLEAAARAMVIGALASR
jgi:AcrR family transcriptional regulator